jgi:tetratricopeptide (TPR) repeat protein
MIKAVAKISLSRFRALLLLAMLMGFSAAGISSPYNEVVRQANLEYSSGYYDHALELYLSVVENRYTSADLYYNIGNTFFKLNRIPEAILYYERALRIAPQDENIRFNLELARTRTIDKIETVPELFYKRWFRSFVNLYSADGWGYLGIVTMFLTMILAVVFLLSTKRIIRVFSFYLAIAFLAVSLTTMVLAATQHYWRTGKPEAIVFEPSVTVKSSPSEGSIDLFVIHEGTKVKITNQVNEWYEVRLTSGSMGWLRAEVVEEI